MQLTDPAELTLPSNDLLRLPDIQAQIYGSMFDESSMIYAPPERYRFRVLRRLVKALEKAIKDPQEDVCFPISAHVTSMPAHKISSCLPVMEDSSMSPLLMCYLLSRTGHLR